MDKKINLGFHAITIPTVSISQIIEVEAELTANHKGNFVIRLCPLNNKAEKVTQECLNK